MITNLAEWKKLKPQYPEGRSQQIPNKCRTLEVPGIIEKGRKVQG